MNFWQIVGKTRVWRVGSSRLFFRTVAPVVLAVFSGPWPLCAVDVLVTNGQELAREMFSPAPGTTILLAPGTYSIGRTFLSASGGLRGTEGAPIVIASRDPENPAVVEGGFFIPGSAWVTVRDLRIVKPTFHGINADAQSGNRGPANQLKFLRLVIEGAPEIRGTAGLKLSSLDDFEVRDCTFSKWGQSAIDVVGAHRGVIEGNRFFGDESPDAFGGIQIKGGARDIVVRDNYFENTGLRSIQVGGATGAAFMRPLDALFEAERIEIADNLVVGSDACFSFSTQDGTRIHHNICYLPKRWVIRILQENPRMLPNRNGRSDHNLFIFNGVSMTEDGFGEFVNVGPGTAAQTFVFDSNAYYQVDGNSPEYPRTPTPNRNAVDQVDPELIAPGTDMMRIGSSDAAFDTIGPGGTDTSNELLFTAAGFVGGAGFDGTPVAGGVATLFGVFPETATESAQVIPLPTNLGGVELLFFPPANGPAQDTGIAAPLMFTSRGQINFQVPWEAAASSTVDVALRIQGVQSDRVAVPLSSATPGIFTFDAGRGRAIAFNSDGSVAQPLGSLSSTGIVSRPVRPGEVVALLATGLGAVAPPAPSGRSALDQSGAFVPHTTVEPVTARIGGTTANVLFAGLSPEFVGVYQVNVEVSAIHVPGDAVGISLEVNGVESQQNVSIAVSN